METKKKAKREVAAAKREAYKNIYRKLDTKEGENVVSGGKAVRQNSQGCAAGKNGQG